MSENLEYLSDALEMTGLDLSKPKQIVAEISGFVPMFDAVIEHYKDYTRAAVHGAVWRFCQMQDGVCRASLRTISEWLGCNVSTVQRHLDVLVADDYFKDLTPDLRNRPHIYADTGKVVMKGSFAASVAHSNTTVAQSNTGVAQSMLSKDINKDTKKYGSKLPNMPLDWKIAGGQPITDDDLKAEQHRQMVDRANLVALNFGSRGPLAYELALTFQQAFGVVIPEAQCKGQKKAVEEMLDYNVTPDDVAQAVRDLVGLKFNIKDIYSIKNPAIALANKRNAKASQQSQPKGDGFLLRLPPDRS